MRTIKFRAWDKIKKKIVMVDNIEFMPDSNDGEDINHWHDITRHILMQFIGLSDKNGKEIYEGDIFPCIYYFDGCKKHKLEVVFDEESAGFRLKNHGECHQPNVTKRISDMERQEIIGNIYSNPEFLQEKK